MLKKLRREKRFKLSKSIKESYEKYSMIAHKLNTTANMCKKMMKFYKKKKIENNYAYLMVDAVADYNEVESKRVVRI